MALLAHYTRVWSGRYYGYWRGGMADSTRAATAFAVLNWLLFLVTLAAIRRCPLHPNTPVPQLTNSQSSSPAAPPSTARTTRTAQAPQMEPYQPPSAQRCPPSSHVNHEPRTQKRSLARVWNWEVDRCIMERDQRTLMIMGRRMVRAM